jgi:hypothetical protein
MSDGYESVEDEVDEVDEESEEEVATKKKRREKKWKVCMKQWIASYGENAKCRVHNDLNVSSTLF